MRVGKEDLPVIFSIVLAGIVSILDLANIFKISAIILVLLFGWFGRKKIKENEMKKIRDIVQELKETPGFVDVKSLKEKVPLEILPIVDVLSSLVQKVQEYELEKLELENMLKYANPDEFLKLKEKLKEAEEKIEKMRQKVGYLELIYDVMSKIDSSLDMDELLNSLARMLSGKLKVEKFAILIMDENKGELVVRATYGLPSSIKGLTFAPTEGVTGLAFSTGEKIYIPDTRRDRRYLHWKGEYLEEGSFLSIPLKFGNEILGVLNLNKSQVAGFSDDEIELMEKISSQIAMAIKTSKLINQIRWIYSRDVLTGLFNRNAMMDKVENAISKSENFSFILLDIDDFRNINLEYGYNFGDRVLVEISKILLREFRKIDVISRFGGDEFAIMILGATKDQALKEIQRIMNLMEYDGFDEAKIKISFSAGISEFPQECRTSKEVFELADMRLLLAKKNGKGQIVI
jgi:diguanylate cyclase (GGDEF)-like protein